MPRNARRPPRTDAPVRPRATGQPAAISTAASASSGAAAGPPSAPSTDAHESMTVRTRAARLPSASTRATNSWHSAPDARQTTQWSAGAGVGLALAAVDGPFGQRGVAALVVQAERALRQSHARVIGHPTVALTLDSPSAPSMSSRFRFLSYLTSIMCDPFPRARAPRLPSLVLRCCCFAGGSLSAPDHRTARLTRRQVRPRP